MSEGLKDCRRNLRRRSSSTLVRFSSLRPLFPALLWMSCLLAHILNLFCFCCMGTSLSWSPVGRLAHLPSSSNSSSSSTLAPCRRRALQEYRGKLTHHFPLEFLCFRLVSHRLLELSPRAAMAAVNLLSSSSRTALVMSVGSVGACSCSCAGRPQEKGPFSSCFILFSFRHLVSRGWQADGSQ